MESKPKLNKTDQGCGSGRSPKHINKDPLDAQVIRRLGNQPPHSTATAAQTPSGTPQSLTSDAKVGTGHHPAFDNSRIKASVIDPGESVLNLRQGYTPKLYPTLAKSNESDPRVSHACEGLWSGRKTTGEKQAAKPTQVKPMDCSDARVAKAMQVYTGKKKKG